MTDLVRGDDGLLRCPWGASTPDYQRYHDTEWGRPVHGDVAVFERLTLEAFRAAFDRFDIERVATYAEPERERLMSDAGIVRNRAKVEATIANARAAAALREAEGDGALDGLVWSFAPAGRRARPRRLADLTASTAESTALAKELKRHGFVFVGPTTMHAAMQAMGLVDDHLTGCAAVRGAG